ncbi:MAG: hypothetical protein WD431_01015, partial [Cyclobacteriaceae bacterium]
MGNDPRPKGCKKLKGREGYRVRVADYRIIGHLKTFAPALTILFLKPFLIPFPDFLMWNGLTFF